MCVNISSKVRGGDGRNSLLITCFVTDRILSSYYSTAVLCFVLRMRVCPVGLCIEENNNERSRPFLCCCTAALLGISTTLVEERTESARPMLTLSAATERNRRRTYGLAGYWGALGARAGPRGERTKLIPSRESTQSTPSWIPQEQHCAAGTRVCGGETTIEQQGWGNKAGIEHDLS